MKTSEFGERHRVERVPSSEEVVVDDIYALVSGRTVMDVAERIAT